MKAITVLLYRNYSKMFKKNLNVLFYRRQPQKNEKKNNNNFRYSKYNYGSGLKKKGL